MARTRATQLGAVLGLVAQLGCGSSDEHGVPGETGGAGGAAAQGGSAAGGSAGSGGEGLSCADVPPLESSALSFDGEHAVSMGPAPSLGAQTFTLEGWMRRDARGTEASTGVGGLHLVPLISKGRGESDGSNVDCNYAFGLVGDVLGADFEDYASGANHPVVGHSPLGQGRWHHVAATYDGSSWQLYLDGNLDGQAVANATPRYDSIQHFGLGAAFNSQGVAAGGFVGALDEVRVYSRALSQDELRATMYSTMPSADGLIGHFHLDVADGTVVDASGHGHNADLSGTTFVEPGAVLDRGLPPTMSHPATHPSPDGLVLSVDVSDPDGDPVSVDFYARKLTSADDFTLVAVPDSQYYTRDAHPPERPNPDDATYLYKQMQWAVDHRSDRNVVGLFHLGDQVDTATSAAQRNHVDHAYGILEAFQDPSMPNGMPFSPCVGNHDQDPNGTTDGTTDYNGYLGLTRFAGRGYFGGSFDDDNDEHWVRFQAGDLEIIVVSMQYAPTPDSAVLDWAREVFATHPRALGIVATHSILTTAGNFSGQGGAIYEALKDVPNLQLMASGHVEIDARRTDDFEGNVIHSMLSDYQRSAPDPNDPSKPLVGDQGLTNGGHGYMRIWRFAPAEQKLYVETYSPKEDASYTDDRNQFALDVDIVGAGGAFAQVASVRAAGGHASTPALALTPGDSFEWYAVATDCLHQTELDLQLVRGTPP